MQHRERGAICVLSFRLPPLSQNFFDALHFLLFTSSTLSLSFRDTHTGFNALNCVLNVRGNRQLARQRNKLHSLLHAREKETKGKENYEVAMLEH